MAEKLQQLISQPIPRGRPIHHSHVVNRVALHGARVDEHLFLRRADRTMCAPEDPGPQCVSAPGDPMADPAA